MKPPKPDDRISEYILLEKIGSGTFGQVFKARHHVWPEQIVAVKIPTDPEFVRVLRREGSVMHRVRHPNVVRPLGFDPFADPPYLITEYVVGGDLRKLLARGPLPLEQALDILEQVLEGLGAAHDAGVVHLDLKPSNILLTDPGEPGPGPHGVGQVKLTDFGLGRALMAGNDESLIQSLSLAAENSAVVGTLEYMAPEMRRRDVRDPVDHRADLYSVGVVMFEMLTGDRPAGGETPSEVRPELPAWLDAIYRRCYCRLQSRYASTREVLADIRRLRQGEAGPVIEGQPVERPRPTSAGGPIRAAVAVDALQVRRCPRCEGEIRADDQFCISCGTQLTETVRRCGRCGAFPQPHDRFCVTCGSPL